jgi:hypothetical protein
MGKENIRHKKKSIRSFMKRIRLYNLKRKRGYSSSSSSNTNEESTTSGQNQSPSSMGNVGDDLDFYLLIHMKSLVLLLQQFLCSECNSFWDGSVSLFKKEMG